ncbi:MAG: BrnT family toxin [Rhizobiales bacterium]|nr:BrnT family toxin [Hyphomicrobiales bacterium]
MPSHPRLDRLVWDDWNRDHLAKHAVLPEEAEEMVAGDPMVRQTSKDRLQVIGPNLTGRILPVVTGRVPNELGAYDVFSARPASRKERDMCRKLKGGSTP